MGASDQGAKVERWATIPRTLIFLRHGDSVLLMKRSPNARIFPGRYNGIGGHIERDEDVYTAALREIEEETGLTTKMITALQLRGVLQVDAKSEIGIMVFVFTADALTHKVHANDEGSLAWVNLAEVANLTLVDDLPLLLPRLFGTSASGSLFFGHSSYDQHDQLVLRFAI